MKKALLALAAALSLSACQSFESATVSGSEIAANHGEAVAVMQAEALGLTAIFHLVDIVESDLDTVVNKKLVAEAKAMGATKVELKSASTTPRHGIYMLAGGIIGVTSSQAMGIAVK